VKRFFSLLAWPLLVAPQAVYYFGALLNQIAVNANKGLMPVYMASCSIGKAGQVIQGVRVLDEMHSCMTPASHFIILCDWINLHASILSVGDVLLELGAMSVGPLFWIWIAYLLRCAYLQHRES